ncbi:chorismate-binding protein [Aquabacterium sp. CECT 9606]|uniref:chorismate-binding protein n=1 Tax=Aquabacterium sp. CECT 9606 TaxID=2845822 RepID=UPI001E41CEBA|nr:chorismate-binding protein [Aquabacterium sp. CECT 9606]CAH0349424.1 Isochorismate synthase MenF [Aquabacterium sp. CECT 9606]
MSIHGAPSPTLAALLDFPAAQGGRQRLAFGPAMTWLVATELAQVRSVIDTAHEQARQGRWCLGWVAYEAAPAFDDHLPVCAPQPGQALAMFAVFDQALAWPSAAQQSAWQTAPWQSALSPHAFTAQVEAIHELIRAGEVYQINLTTPLRSRLEPQTPETALQYFHALHRSQPDGYAVYLDATAQPAAAGLSHVLSVSPELFFHWQGDQITTRPMKGTAARGTTPDEDVAAARHLQTSDKERAENLMIVDLLRNDLSRIAQVGSVQVPSLFDVQALPTVWQMTSTVQARTREGLRLSDVFAALFPCGSITGAPKRRAMHHIAALEGAPRGVYCGAVGLMAPGGEVTFNVPIRTVVLQPSTHAGWDARCGIGSGITLDATVEAEAKEWRHKQAFLKRAAQPFEVLESLRLEDGHIPRLDAHLQRMARAARHFGFPWDASAVRDALMQHAQSPTQGIHKIRLLLDAQGQATFESSPLALSQLPIRVALARQAMPVADEFIAHKTTQRTAYAPFNPPPGCFDTLLWNGQGELTEFTIGNVAVKLGGEWFTPPLSAGLLPGVMRETLLAEGRLRERTITVDELRHAEGIALINSVRGWMDAELLPTEQPAGD